MFYSQCNNCNERWELGTASTCACVKNCSATIPVDRFSHLGQRTWVGLTNDEVNNIAAGCHLGNSVQDAIFRAEQIIKEKNT